MKPLDPKLNETIVSAINEYVHGRPYTALAFDILRTEPAPSMESVIMLLMNEDDWKTISLLMRIIHNKENINVKDKVFRAIVDTLEKAKNNK